MPKSNRPSSFENQKKKLEQWQISSQIFIWCKFLLARAFTVSCLTWNSKQPKITQAKENCGLYIQKCWQSIIEKKGEDPWQVIGNRRRNGRKSNNKPTQQQRAGVVRSSIVMVPWNEEDGTFYQVNIYSEVITARENLGQICT